MKHGQIETLKIRLKSTFFVLFTLAVFKPFGIDALQWHTCLYLLVFLIPGGMLVCMLTDAILKYVCRMPHTNKFGVDYIIHQYSHCFIHYLSISSFYTQSTRGW